jgi:hypothetical protein
LNQNETTPKEIVLKVYPDAHCAGGQGRFQIRYPSRGTSLPKFLYLSSLHVTEEEAWYFAGVRINCEEVARTDAESNKSVVLRTYPDAYCAAIRGGYFQIQRRRTGSEKIAVLKYMPLSGRFSSEYFAWQDAAKTLLGVGITAAPRQNIKTKARTA